MNSEERAEKLLRQALAIDEARLNPMHPDIVQSLSDLADLLINQHRYAEAEPLLQRAGLFFYKQRIQGIRMLSLCGNSMQFCWNAWIEMRMPSAFD